MDRENSKFFLKDHNLNVPQLMLKNAVTNIVKTCMNLQSVFQSTVLILNGFNTVINMHLSSCPNLPHLVACNLATE